MAWMSDEAWEMVSDSRDKKITARSARSTRTHCGKRGAVKFPSDYKSRKELKAMNGEVETYRMNSPMSWDEFVKMPLDLQRKYISHLREKFNVPDEYLAEMFYKPTSSFIDHLFRLKMSAHTPKEGETWDVEGFMAWRLGVDVGKTEPVPVVENEEEKTMDILNRPMKFEQFKRLTNEQKKEYLENLRKKFDVPNNYVAKMLDCSDACVSSWARKLNVGYGRPLGSHRGWDEAGWDKWLNGEQATTEENPVEEPEIIIGETAAQNKLNDIPVMTDKEQKNLDAFVQDLRELSAEVVEGTKVEKKVEAKTEEQSTCCFETKCAVPHTGEMTFNGNVDDILRTIRMLLNGSNVCLEVKWFVHED